MRQGNLVLVSGIKVSYSHGDYFTHEQKTGPHDFGVKASGLAQKNGQESGCKLWPFEDAFVDIGIEHAIDKMRMHAS